MLATHHKTYKGVTLTWEHVNVMFISDKRITFAFVDHHTEGGADGYNAEFAKNKHISPVYPQGHKYKEREHTLFDIEYTTPLDVEKFIDDHEKHTFNIQYLHFLYMADCPGLLNSYKVREWLRKLFNDKFVEMLHLDIPLVHISRILSASVKISSSEEIKFKQSLRDIIEIFHSAYYISHCALDVSRNTQIEITNAKLILNRGGGAHLATFIQELYMNAYIGNFSTVYIPSNTAVTYQPSSIIQDIVDGFNKRMKDALNMDFPRNMLYVKSHPSVAMCMAVWNEGDISKLSAFATI